MGLKSFIKIKLRENISLLAEISVKDAWTKFYSDKTKFPVLNGNEELFNALNDLIPNSNTGFNKGAFTWLYNLRKNNQLKDEDFYKAKEYLGFFNKFINKIPKENRDLMKLKSLGDLYVMVKPFIEGGENQATSKTQELKNIKQNEVRKVYEDNQWLISIPLTERASCLIGKGTQWCTAADKSNNLFDRYNNQGHLYVMINKYDDAKYQLHFETDSLMDANDRPIDGAYFFEYVVEDKDVQDYFEKNIPEFWDFIVGTGLDGMVESGGYTEMFNEAIGKMTNETKKENALSELRGSSESDAMYIGFMEEKNPRNISSYDVENLTEYDDENDNLKYILEHLVQIGYDFGDVENISLQTYVAGKELLNDYKLRLDTPYKVDKGRTLKIHRINFNEGEPTFRISLGDDVGNVNMKTLLNYLHQGHLFETKTKLREKLLK